MITNNLKEIRNFNTVFHTPNINNFNPKYMNKSPITPALERIKWINFYSMSQTCPKIDKYFSMISPDQKDKILKEVLSKMEIQHRAGSNQYDST
jgi:hypothetical protein